MKNDIAKLSKTLYENHNFSKNEVSGQDVLRKLFYQALEVEEGTRGGDLFNAYQQNKFKVFAIINSAISAVLPSIVTNDFDNLAEVHNIEVGDNKTFTIRDKQLFPISLVAAGTQDLKRNKLAGRSYTVDTDTYGVKIYTELEDFLTGKTDWNDYVDSVGLSFTNFIGERIFKTIELGYSGLRAKHKAQGGSEFDVSEVVRIARHVKASNAGAKVSVYGTLGALSNITGFEMSESMKDEKNAKGFIGRVQGIDLIAIPDAVDLASEEFVVSDKTLIFVPGSEKLIDVVIEGEPITTEGDGTLRNDLQMEFVTLQRFGVHVKQAAVYGMYKLA